MLKSTGKDTFLRVCARLVCPGRRGANHLLSHTMSPNIFELFRCIRLCMHATLPSTHRDSKLPPGSPGGDIHKHASISCPVCCAAPAKRLQTKTSGRARPQLSSICTRAHLGKTALRVQVQQTALRLPGLPSILPSTCAASICHVGRVKVHGHQTGMLTEIIRSKLRAYVRLAGDTVSWIINKLDPTWNLSDFIGWHLARHCHA